MTDYYRRGDILLADLDPIQGSEQGGIRPVLCISNNIGNKYSNIIIVAAITSAYKKHLPTHLPLLDIDFLAPDSVLLLEQIRTIDLGRIHKYLGSLSDRMMLLVDHALAISVGLKPRKQTGLYMTLCSKCAQTFYESPYHRIYRTDPSQTIKESCSYCGCRSGFDYHITPEKNLDQINEFLNGK